jgi:peroxiredoxin Q/BCP
MSLKIGQTAPDFTLPSTSGKDLSLSRDLKDTACILFFYPKDFTRVCTAEACGFRDNMEVFNTLDIPVLGVSRDDISTHLRFKKTLKIPYDLLSDEDGKICNAYDALVPLLKIPKRVTYLLDRDHTVKTVYQGMFDAGKHIQAMILSLK